MKLALLYVAYYVRCVCMLVILEIFCCHYCIKYFETALARETHTKKKETNKNNKKRVSCYNVIVMVEKHCIKAMI